jgi:Flp pilus assembly protein TadG
MTVRGEHGQSVVEFAMVLPFLAALVMIFIQFGKAINYWIDLTHVANEGARYATVGAPGSSTAAAFKAGICSDLETGELRNGTGEVNAAKVTVTYPTTGHTDVGDPINVKVAAKYNWLPFWKLTGIHAFWTIEGSATMRLERDATGNAALASGTGTCPAGS